MPDIPAESPDRAFRRLGFVVGTTMHPLLLAWVERDRARDTTLAK